MRTLNSIIFRGEKYEYNMFSYLWTYNFSSLSSNIFDIELIKDSTNYHFYQKIFFEYYQICIENHNKYLVR